MKDHDRLREALHAFRDGELAEPESREVASHLQACSDCRETLAVWERFANAALKVPAGLASEAFVGGVMAHIAEEEAEAEAPSGFGWWLAPSCALALGLTVLLWPENAVPSLGQLLLAEAPALTFSQEAVEDDDVLALVLEDAP